MNYILFFVRIVYYFDIQLLHKNKYNTTNLSIITGISIFQTMKPSFQYYRI